MKILRITYEWPSPWDGLAPAPYEITHAQEKKGHTFDIFCGRWPFSGDVEVLPNTKFTTFFREPLPGLLLVTIAPFVLIKYLIWRRKNKPDLIHSHGHFAAWIYLYRRFLQKFFKGSKELKIPLVVHFHNTFKGRWISLEKKGSPIKPLTKYISWPLGVMSDRLAVKTADACIFVSGEIKEEAAKYYQADPGKCYVVENGVNVELFSPVGWEEKSKTRLEMGLDPNSKVILNHGKMVERKNIHLLIEALAFLPFEYKLILAGPAERDYEIKLSSVMAEKKVKDRVIRIGYVPYPEVPILFQASDIFVLPSSWEGMPKVVMQSLACGTPVLASGFKVQNEINGLYYLDELTAERTAQKIKDIVEAKGYVDVGFVRSGYSWDVAVHKIDEIYEKIVSFTK